MALWIDNHYEEDSADDGDIVPTAIVIIQTSEGFVIASDGKAGEGLDVRKVFPIQSGPMVLLAYGLSGYGGANDPNNGLDLRLTDFINQAFLLVPQEECADLDALISLVARKAQGLLREAIESERRTGRLNDEDARTLLIQPSPSRMHVCGYFRDHPSMSFCDLMYGEQWSASPTRRNAQDGWGRTERTSFYGSAVVRSILKSGILPPELRQFGDEADKGIYEGADVSLKAAVQCASRYIRACGSPAGRRLDPRACEEIGGYTHIATITKDEGYREISNGAQNYSIGVAPYFRWM